MDVNFDINIDGIRELVKKYPQAVREETAAVMRVVIARLEKDVIEATPKGMGGAAGLAGSIAGEVMSYGAKVTGSVGSPLEYAEVVERGRRPGSFPPVDPIALWAIVKLGLEPHEAESAAYAIARKIFHRGTEGAAMFYNAWSANEQWVYNQLQTIPERVVRRMEGA